MIDLKRHSAGLIRWLEDPMADIFLQIVEEHKRIQDTILRKDSNSTELYRAQGSIKAYNTILELKEDCQKALKGQH